jgi:medium-chain acyl-[acyl-carrier-protein] hydrolase
MMEELMLESHDLSYNWINDYRVHSYEIDFKGDATFPVLCQFMQETAWEHAEHMEVGFSHLMKRNLIWVLSRQAVKINSFPKWEDKIKIHTWPSGRDRLFCYRDFKIVNEQDDVIGTATTTWFAMDLEKHRPQRTDSYIQWENRPMDKVLPDFARRIERLNSTNETRVVHVTCSDLDVNAHVNHVKYVNYILDSFPLDFMRTHRLTLFEANYLSEALFNDEIAVRYEKKENGSFLHSLMRNSDHIELCRAKTYWERNE